MSFGDKLAAKELRVLSDINKKKGVSDDYTPNMVDFYNYSKGQPCQNPACAHAFDIRKDPFQREVVESLLLLECDPQSVVQVFGITKEVLSVYIEMFFDSTSAFRTKLDRVSYAASYKPSEPDAKNIKMTAMNLGPESVLYTYGGLIPDGATQRLLLQKMFMSSAYKAMTMHFNAIESPAAKQSTEFAKVMMKAYEILERFAPQETATSAEMHQYLLTSMDTFTTTTEQVIDEDIV